jgi:hypothetical protein
LCSSWASAWLRSRIRLCKETAGDLAQDWLRSVCLPLSGWIYALVHLGEEAACFLPSVRKAHPGGIAKRVGDNQQNRQYKTVVSFDTSSIPDGATILSATVRLRRGSLTGTSPFTTHGSCQVDIVNGAFGGSTTLSGNDSNAANRPQLVITYQP